MSKIPEGATHWQDFVVYPFEKRVGDKWFFWNDDTNKWILLEGEKCKGDLRLEEEDVRPITEHPDYIAPEQEAIKQVDWSKAPEDATHFLPESEQFFACWIKPGFTMRAEPGRDWVEDDDDSASHLYVERPVVEPTAWDGTGLPPVGTVCEALWNESRDEWLKTTVFGVNEHGQPIHRWEDGPKKFDYLASPLLGISGRKYFRPIRTPEQIAADEREVGIESLRQLLSEVACDDFHAAVAVYDAGYRKQDKE